MDYIFPREELSALLDEITRAITRREAGICLSLMENAPEKGPEDNPGTVYITFERGMDGFLSVCADEALFVRLAQGMIGTNDLPPEVVEEVAKEYLNVLGGLVLSRLFQAVGLPARFSVPGFRRGAYVPEGFGEHIVLDYTGDQGERLRLLHHISLEARF